MRNSSKILKNEILLLSVSATSMITDFYKWIVIGMIGAATLICACVYACAMVSARNPRKFICRFCPKSVTSVDGYGKDMIIDW